MATKQPVRRRGRPSKNLLGPKENRERLIRAGVVSLTEKGFVATGLLELLQSVDVPKGSFYHYFESKEAFGLEVLASYDSYFVRKLDRWLLDNTRPPVERLRDFIEDAKVGMVRHRFRRGCLVGNLGQELASLPPSYVRRLRLTFAGWELRVARCLADRHSRRTELTDAEDARAAAFFWIGWEGAVLRARLERDVMPLELFAERFLDQI